MGILRLLSGLLSSVSQETARSEQEQKEVDLRTARLALYQFDSCPYCIRVNRTINRLGLNITRRNIHQSAEHAAELRRGGGRSQVPCLHIAHRDKPAEWLYESADIIKYLKQEFS
ncbi:MAG: glutaredoxin [Sedimenticola sp.]